MTTFSPQDYPIWYREFRRLFLAGVAHCFFLTGDIHGVTVQGGTHQAFLVGALGHTREVIACYDPALGITFPLASMQAKALEILGPDWQPPSADDPYSAALDAAGMTSAPADPFRAAKKPARALAILEQLLRSPQAVRRVQGAGGKEELQGRIAVVVDQADLVLPATGKAQMSEERLGVLAMLLSWGHDSVLTLHQNPVVFLTSHLAAVHPDLLHSSSGYRVIEQPLPNEAARRAYLEWYLHTYRRDDPIALLDLTEADLARNTAGLNLRQVEDVLLAGANRDVLLDQDGPVGVTRLHAKERKDAIIRQQYQSTVEMLEPLPGGFADLGGMRQVIAWFRAEVLAPLRAGRLREVPKGILLVGPPGNGKTLLVQAAARELGFHALALLMANILGGIVGTSEHNLQEIFQLARNLAPTFLFLDEIDQMSLSSRGNASGSPVAGNLFGATLQFLGDESLRGQVIVVAATNRPELLDAALLRAGRFDVVFPIFCPDILDRPEVLQVQARVQDTRLDAEALALLTTETERYSAADLGALVKEARFLAMLGNRSAIGVTEARTALDNLRPTTLSSVDAFTQSAVAACNNLRYLPEPLAERERLRLAIMRRQAEQSALEGEARSVAQRGARKL